MSETGAALFSGRMNPEVEVVRNRTDGPDVLKLPYPTKASTLSRENLECDSLGDDDIQRTSGTLVTELAVWCQLGDSTSQTEFA